MDLVDRRVVLEVSVDLGDSLAVNVANGLLELYLATAQLANCSKVGALTTAFYLSSRRPASAKAASASP